MEWEGGRRGGNIEDRRGLGPVGVGGIGAGGVILALVGYFVFGIDPRTTLGVVQGQQGQVEQQEGARGTPADKAAQFVDVIEESTTEVWTPLFRNSGQNYHRPAAAVIYDESTGTGCGLGQSAMGPFYCPTDEKVYLDLSFWNDLESRFGAKGEFARAYVIAHEVGHHVQKLTGQMERVGGDRQGANSGSVRLELQADCYAGVWAAHAGQTSGGGIVINQADIRDGLGAAAAVGDDAIQSKGQGRVVPDSFTHGTSAQRMKWFTRGYERGDPAACDTFAGPI